MVDGPHNFKPTTIWLGIFTLGFWTHIGKTTHELAQGTHTHTHILGVLDPSMAQDLATHATAGQEPFM